MAAKDLLVPFVFAAIPGSSAATLAQQPQWSSLQEALFTGSDSSYGDVFGDAVALDGDTALIGAYSADNENGPQAGAAYVFVRNGTTWTEQQRLIGAPGGLTYFGAAVAVSGDTAVVGAFGEDHSGLVNAGAAYVYVRSGTTWSLQQKLTASDATVADAFGGSVAISEDTIAVGAPSAGSGPNENGSVYVFVRSGATWSEQQELTASDAEEGKAFAESVAILDDTVIVGARHDSPTGLTFAGAAYVFVRSGTTWTELQKLAASSPSPSEEFGEAVAMSENTVLVGAPRVAHSGLQEAGAVYVFERTGTLWTETQELVAGDAGEIDHFGSSISISGDLAVFGQAPQLDNGATYLFARSAMQWSEQQKFQVGDPENTGLFGVSVGMSGTTALVGDSFWGGGDLETTGAVYVFRIFPEAGVYCTAGTSASGCQALLSAAGSASATAPTGFTLSASTVEGQKDGIFFFGTNGQQANSWGNGTSYQCVIPPVVRTPTMAGVGTIGLCDGSFALDLNALWCPSCPKPAKNPGVGATVQAQLWYRDPASTSNQTTSLSDAIEFVLSP